MEVRELTYTSDVGEQLKFSGKFKEGIGIELLAKSCYSLYEFELFMQECQNFYQRVYQFKRLIDGYDSGLIAVTYAPKFTLIQKIRNSIVRFVNKHIALKGF